MKIGSSCAGWIDYYICHYIEGGWDVIKTLEAGIPIYTQIARDIRAKIIRGELSDGDKLPSVREIAADYKVNPNTVQRVFMELDRESLIKSERGVGAFVSVTERQVELMKDDEAYRAVKEFLTSMESLGFKKETIIKYVKNYGKEMPDDKH